MTTLSFLTTLNHPSQPYLFTTNPTHSQPKSFPILTIPNLPKPSQSTTTNPAYHHSLHPYLPFPRYCILSIFSSSPHQSRQKIFYILFPAGLGHIQPNPFCTLQLARPYLAPSSHPSGYSLHFPFLAHHQQQTHRCYSPIPPTPTPIHPLNPAAKPIIPLLASHLLNHLSSRPSGTSDYQLTREWMQKFIRLFLDLAL